MKENLSSHSSYTILPEDFSKNALLEGNLVLRLATFLTLYDIPARCATACLLSVRGKNCRDEGPIMEWNFELSFAGRNSATGVDKNV